MFKPYVFEDKKQLGSNYNQHAQPRKGHPSGCPFCVAGIESSKHICVCLGKCKCGSFFCPKPSKTCFRKAWAKASPVARIHLFLDVLFSDDVLRTILYWKYAFPRRTTVPCLSYCFSNSTQPIGSKPSNHHFVLHFLHKG